MNSLLPRNNSIIELFNALFVLFALASEFPTTCLKSGIFSDLETFPQFQLKPLFSLSPVRLECRGVGLAFEIFNSEAFCQC